MLHHVGSIYTSVCVFIISVGVIHLSEAKISSKKQYSSHARFLPVLTGQRTETARDERCPCGGQEVPGPSRVVGGTEVAPHAYPWMAGIVNSGRLRPYCGGSLINDRYVLTAAHCVFGRHPAEVEVLLSDHRVGELDVGETRHAVSRIKVHSQYIPGALYLGDDLALLRLENQVTFTSFRSPVCLPSKDNLYEAYAATASGFGLVGDGLPQANTLLEVEMQVISNSECSKRWPGIGVNSLCAEGAPEGGTGTCFGDSGGPLVTGERGRFVIIGVLSFGEPCARPGSPDVFGRVTSALDWIGNITRDAETCAYLG